MSLRNLLKTNFPLQTVENTTVSTEGFKDVISGFFWW